MGWAKDLGSKEIEREARQQADLERAKYKTDQISAKLPAFWQRLKQAVESDVDDYNSAFDCPRARVAADLDCHRLTVIRSARIEWSANIHASSVSEEIGYSVTPDPLFEEKLKGSKGTFRLDLGADGQLRLYDLEGKLATPELVAKTILDDLLSR